MSDKIRVVVADRRRSVAEILALGLQQVGILGSAVTGMTQACRAATEQQADLILADAGLMATDEASATSWAWPGHPPVPLIVLSDGGRSDDLACAALRAGVRGWVSKDSSMQQLLTVIEGVLRGETWVPPALLTRVLADLFAMREDLEEEAGRLATLTTREREVLGCLSGGMSRAEIGRRLFLSTNTVRTHVQNLMIKLDVHSSVAAVALAHRVGMPPRLWTGSSRTGAEQRPQRSGPQPLDHRRTDPPGDQHHRDGQEHAHHGGGEHVVRIVRADVDP